MPMGPEFEHHGALYFVLQGLGGFPGLGWDLVRAGLRSPVVRNRNMAIRALASWGAEQWPAGARELLEECRNTEPDEGVKTSFDKTLAGQPLGM